MNDREPIISIERVKEILGNKAVGLTDEQINSVLFMFEDMSSHIIDKYTEKLATSA